MKKKLYTILVAVIEDDDGWSRDDVIARKEGDTPFTEDEKKSLVEKYSRNLHKDEIICDVYEDLQWLYY